MFSTFELDNIELLLALGPICMAQLASFKYFTVFNQGVAPLLNQGAVTEFKFQRYVNLHS